MYINKTTDFSIINSVGTIVNLSDNVLAKVMSALYKAEVTECLKQNWNGASNVRLITLE